MTETWADLQWFALVVGGSSSGATQIVDVGELDTSATPWSGSNPSSGGSSGSSSEASTTDDSITTSPAGGTGSTPPISVGTDYWLRDENNDDSITTSPAGGTGSTPPISVGTDYWLRDENNEVITDENGEGYSLEGAL